MSEWSYCFPLILKFYRSVREGPGGYWHGKFASLSKNTELEEFNCLVSGTFRSKTALYPVRHVISILKAAPCKHNPKKCPS
jgi:hypothetical protein